MKIRIGMSVLLVALIGMLSTGAWSQGGGAPQTQAAPQDTVAPPDTASNPVYPVELKVDTAFTYVAYEVKGSYDQHEQAIGMLYQEAGKQGIMGGMPFGIYWNNPAGTPPEQLSWEVGFAAPADTKVQPPLKLKKWAFPTAAHLRYTGPFDDNMDNARQRLYKWINDNGYKPLDASMEMFLSAPSPDENGVLFGTVEMVVPVEKAAPEAPKAKAVTPK